MMILITVLLVWVPQSLSNFIDGRKVCYDIVGLENKDFELQYAIKVLILPEQMQMQTSYLIINHANKDVTGQHVNFTVILKEGNCGDTIDIFMHLGNPGFHSTYFISFFFGSFLVEHFIINPNDEGEATVYGTRGRASLKIFSKRFEGELTKPSSEESLVIQDLQELSGGNFYVLTFMNYGYPRGTHILPKSTKKLKLPKMIIVKMTLVDMEGNPIQGVPQINDLVKIAGSSPSKLKNKMYYSSGFKNHNIEIRILTVNLKEIAKSNYPLTQAKFGDSATSKSDFSLMGVELVEVSDNASTLPEGYQQNDFQFLKITKTLLKCHVQRKEAFVIKFKLGTLDLWSESRCSVATDEKENILHHSPCTDEDAENCK
ncbi:hypothetical protein RF11_10978 [Thelohanellus kitauei]|uniref:Uncharacterized protein n=1 Tax=Thelohanellus kitauei TaxID=669202 RepID=A0A0C2M1V4_THEKT|nr:hypothetical protein RF11_10978 [Thelohanellus kitauei]